MQKLLRLLVIVAAIVLTPRVLLAQDAAAPVEEEAAPAAEPLPSTALSLDAPEEDAAPVLGTPAVSDELTADAAEAEDADADVEAPNEVADEVPVPAPSPPPYRGSLFSWQHGITVNTLNPDAQLTYNPTYYWSFFLQPRWYLDGQNFLVLSQGLSIEWTDADFTTTDREPQLSDTVLEWRHTEAFEGFVFIPSVRLAAPLSNASQAADRVLNTGVGLTAVRVIPEAWDLTIALTLAYRHWWALGNVTTTGAPYRCASTELSSGSCDQAGAQSTERDRLLGALTLTVSPFSGFTITTQYALLAVYGHELATVTNPGVGGPSELADASVTHWRNFQYWTLAVAYDVVSWLNLSLGYQSASSVTTLYNDNGTVRNPFYNPDSELYLSATLAIDGLVEEIVGAEEDGLTPEMRQRRRQGLSVGPRRGASL